MTRFVLALLWLLPASATAQAFRHPSACHDGCMTVSAYRDHGGGTDWNCGGITYGGHGGTDFATYGGWGAVDEGREVLAAAEGVVVEAHDGEFDRCTTGSCSGGGGWGNYVAIQHADGVITYYAHQRTGSIAVGVGEWVTCGQHLGFIASSGSSTGPHLHFEPRAGGGFDPFGFGGCSDPSSRWIDQGAYAALPGAACPVTDRLPEGWIDAAACDGVRGWARDPDDNGAIIDVHVYFDGPAGDPAATGYPLHTGIPRPDVGGDHGFSFRVPLGFLDGRDHAVFAYGIGAWGGGNALLSGAPATLHCDVPTPQFADGVRRHVTDPAAFAAWRFDLRDIVHLDDATLAHFAEADAWPAAPALVGAPGDPGVYLRDVRGGVEIRRHVPSPDAMDAWRLDWGAIASLDLAALEALANEGPISDRPFLAQGSGPEVWVIDAARPIAPQPDAGPMRTGDAGAAHPDAGVATDGAAPTASHGRPPTGISGGCSVGGRGSPLAALVLLALLLRRATRP